MATNKLEQHEVENAPRSMSPDIELTKPNFERIDKEVARYAGTERVEIDPATDKRLKTMIDRRVLSVMIVTYFLQALDKGTISFVSIMKLPEDTGLQGQEVSSIIPVHVTLI